MQIRLPAGKRWSHVQLEMLQQGGLQLPAPVQTQRCHGSASLHPALGCFAVQPARVQTHGEMLVPRMIGSPAPQHGTLHDIVYVCPLLESFKLKHSKTLNISNKRCLSRHNYRKTLNIKALPNSTCMFFLSIAAVLVVPMSEISIWMHPTVLQPTTTSPQAASSET